MSNQTKKQEELTSLNEFINQCSDSFAKKLSKCQNISELNQERPDVLLTDGQIIYGIDHIYLPIFREGDGDADQVQKGREKTVFREFQIDTEKGINKLEGHEGEAIGKIENIVDKKYLSISNYRFEEYIQYCGDRLKKHDALVYRENINMQFPEKNCCICYLLDIPHPDIIKTFEYYHLVNHKRISGYRKDYPFTKAFLDCLYKWL